jgi:hypothetical protein
MLQRLRRAPGSEWLDQSQLQPERPWMIVTVPEFDPHLARQASVILYSYRDIRDAPVCEQRQDGSTPMLNSARHWMEQDRLWREHATFVLRYESLLADPDAAIVDLARALQITIVDHDSLFAEFAHREFHAERADSILHLEHLTDAGRNSLNPVLLAQIERECGDWLAANGYNSHRNKASRAA